MDRKILDIVNDSLLWKGDVYLLAALVAEAQREIDVVEFTPAPEDEE